MKILIWVLGYAVMTIIYILTAGVFANAGSFVLWLESVAYLVAWIWVSIVLCKKWDEHRGVKSLEKIPVSVIKDVQQYRGKPTELSAFLKGHLKNKRITKAQAKYLYKSYSKETYND